MSVNKLGAFRLQEEEADLTGPFFSSSQHQPAVLDGWAVNPHRHTHTFTHTQTLKHAQKQQEQQLFCISERYCMFYVLFLTANTIYSPPCASHRHLEFILHVRACCRLRGGFAIFYAASLEKNAKNGWRKRGRELPVNALNRKSALRVLLRILSQCFRESEAVASF